MENIDLSRRNMLKITGMSALALGATSAISRTISDTCGLTPRQPEGPFYPVAAQDDTNTDLTLLNGGTNLALGEIVYLSGVVQDQSCQPVAGVVVEIWQACAAGRYNHPGDRENPNPLDPDFQYWGIALTNAAGEYSFKTVKPGHYLASPGWIRPPHIHFRVHKRGIKELITQMYFEGNEYNAADKILRQVPVAERPSVVRPMFAKASEAGRNVFNMTFDISVEKYF